MDAARRLGAAAVKAQVLAAQARARAGEIAPRRGRRRCGAAACPARATTLRPVINATGVVLHTNLGRAPLSPAALEALDGGRRRLRRRRVRRGHRPARARADAAPSPRSRAAVPDAGAVLVVNNGAAALVLATTALAAGREVVVSRGEMVEIGDGFRLHELIASTGARLREVGTTNRTSLRDYADGGRPGHRLHPQGAPAATSASRASPRPSPVGDLAGARRARSSPTSAAGCCAPTRCCPTSRTPPPRCARAPPSSPRSGDKLLGGPQAGLLLGRRGRSSSACAATRWPAPCGSTSSPSPRSRRRCAGPRHADAPATCTPTPTRCARRAERLAGRGSAA